MSRPEARRAAGAVCIFLEETMERSKIEELVYKSCLTLDDKDYKGYLDLCDDDFR